MIGFDAAGDWRLAEISVQLSSQSLPSAFTEASTTATKAKTKALKREQRYHHDQG